MREIIIRITCDFCNEQFEEEKAKAITLNNGSETFEGDACDPCLGNLTTVLRQVKKEKSKTTGEYACAKCGRTFARQANRDNHQQDCPGKKT